SSMDIVGVNTAGSATLSSTGALSDAGATSVAVTGLGSFSGTSISLGGGTFNTGTLTFNSAGAVTIAEDSDMALTGANSGSTVTLNSTGAISQPAGTLAATTLTGSAGTTVTLNQANTVTNLGAFSSNGGFTLNDTTGG